MSIVTGSQASRQAEVIPQATQRVTPFGVITVRSGRPLAYSAELKAHARHRFEETPESEYSIATDLGMHHVSLKRLAKREGGVRRNPPPLREITGVMRLAQEVEALARVAASPPPGAGRSTAKGMPPTPDPSPPLASLAGGGEQTECGEREQTEPAAPASHQSAADTSAIDRLEAAVLKELAVVERQRAELGREPLRPFDANIIARTLASLTETLSKLRRHRLAAQPQADQAYDDMPADIDEFRNELARRIRALVASQIVEGDTERDRAAVASAPEP